MRNKRVVSSCFGPTPDEMMGGAPPKPLRLVRRRRNPSRAFDCHHLGRAVHILALVGYFLTVVLPWFLKVVVPMAGWG